MFIARSTRALALGAVMSSLFLGGCVITRDQKIDYAKGLSETALCGYAIGDASRENSEIARAELASRGIEDWLSYCQPLLSNAQAIDAQQRANLEADQKLMEGGLCTMKGGTMTSYGCIVPPKPAPSFGTTTNCYARPGGGFSCYSN